MSKPGSREWHLEQVAQFNRDRGNYARIAAVLENVLNEIKRRTDPTAIVQVRPKSLASFSEKAIRRRNMFDRPAEQFMDLVGGRMITYTQTAADAICRFIESLDPAPLVIDWDHSGDTAKRLKPEEFGYKAMHYVVRLAAPEVLGVPVDNWIHPYKMEIQISTMLQHVWAAITHDRLYKARLTVSDVLKRRLSAVSALLDTAQAEFDSGIVALDRYIHEYLPHRSAAAREDERLIWESVVQVEPLDAQARKMLGEHFASLGQWEKAYEQFLNCDENLPEIQRKRGCAAARTGRISEALDLFQKAASRDRGDWSVRCDLAALLDRNGEHEQALQHLRDAFESAPHEPLVLVGYVSAIVRREGQTSCTAALGGALQAAIQECQRRADLRVDLPFAFLQAGRCHLFRGDVYSALDAYCKAGLTCASLEPLEAERRDIDVIRARLQQAGHAQSQLSPFECAVKLLDLLSVPIALRMRRAGNRTTRTSIVERQPTDPSCRAEVLGRLDILATPPTDRVSFANRPVVIVAGGCDKAVEEQIKAYRSTLESAFRGFSGTIVCGGTMAGISGVIGEISGQRAGAVHCVGYLPTKLPPGDVRDSNHYATCTVHDDGTTGYSPLGPIQTWADLLLCGLEPADVRLLGINGGKLSAFEFRLAMALGAAVGLVEDSGRAASALLADPDWTQLGRPAALFNDAATIAAFITAHCPTLQAIGPEEREQKLDGIARAKHESYLASHLASQGYVHDSMLPWDQGLDDCYKISTRQQFEYADRILATEGFGIIPSDDPRPPVDFRDPEYEGVLDRMARLEHGRFNAERLAGGWSHGPRRDLVAKTSPHLVPWEKLPDEVRQWDRDPFLELAALLAPQGLKVVRLAETRRAKKRSGGD